MAVPKLQPELLVKALLSAGDILCQEAEATSYPQLQSSTPAYPCHSNP